MNIISARRNEKGSIYLKIKTCIFFTKEIEVFDTDREFRFSGLELYCHKNGEDLSLLDCQKIHNLLFIVK